MNDSILFPCMFAVGDVLLCGTRHELLKFYVKTHLHDNTYLIRRSGGKRKPFFVLERNGKLRLLQLKKQRRQMLTWLVPIWDFVLGEYELTRGMPITCSELSEKIKSLNNKHLSDGPALRRFLNKQEKDRVFDATLFKEFWEKNCQKLSEEQWQEQYPEG